MLTVGPVMPCLARPGLTGTNDAAKAAFKEMERLFIDILLEEMRNSVPEGGLLPKSPASRHFEEMLDDILSLQMAESGQFGVAKLLEAQYRQSMNGIVDSLDPGRGRDLAAQVLK